jgi:hypothetical protein
MPSGLPAGVREELAEAFDSCLIEPFAHPMQRNRTFMVVTSTVNAVAKLYIGLGVSEVEEIGCAEALVARAGVPVPRLLYRSTAIPLVVHEYVPGEHRQPTGGRDIRRCADWFHRQLDALRSFVPARVVRRPAQPPLRARLAADRAKDARIRALIWATWDRLSVLANRTVATVSNTDWRTDNFLSGPHGLSAVVDWESLVTLPAGEAVGYAAASFTHSWRGELYRPFDIAEASSFVAALPTRSSLLAEPTSSLQLRLALAFTGAVRLGEDQARGLAVATPGDILAILEDGDLPSASDLTTS